MLGRITDFSKYSRACFLVIAILVLLFPASLTYGSVHFSLLSQPRITISTPPVALQSGTAGTSTIYTNGTSAKVTAVAGQALYAHQENLGLGYALKLNSADSAGTTFSVSAATAVRVAWGSWVYQLAGVASIPASTWSFYYRANTTSSSVVAHCDVDIQIRMANGTTRQTIATDVANSGSVITSWSTLLGTYVWLGYTVVDATDYLQFDYYAHVVTKKNGEYLNLRVDDSTLGQADQTRSANMYLPKTWDYILRINNTAVDSWQIRLKRYSDSNIIRLKNCTIYFRNSTGGNTGQVIVQNGVFITPTGPWCGLGSSMTTYIALTTQTNSTGTSYVNTYLEIRIPNTTTYAQYIIRFEIT